MKSYAEKAIRKVENQDTFSNSIGDHIAICLFNDHESAWGQALMQIVSMGFCVRSARHNVICSAVHSASNHHGAPMNDLRELSAWHVIFCHESGPAVFVKA